jgi:hypothetical protein
VPFRVGETAHGQVEQSWITLLAFIVAELTVCMAIELTPQLRRVVVSRLNLVLGRPTG